MIHPMKIHPGWMQMQNKTSASDGYIYTYTLHHVVSKWNNWLECYQSRYNTHMLQVYFKYWNLQMNCLMRHPIKKDLDRKKMPIETFHAKIVFQVNRLVRYQRSIIHALTLYYTYKWCAWWHIPQGNIFVEGRRACKHLNLNHTDNALHTFMYIIWKYWSDKEAVLKMQCTGDLSNETYKCSPWWNIPGRNILVKCWCLIEHIVLIDRRV